LVRRERARAQEESIYSTNKLVLAVEEEEESMAMGLRSRRTIGHRAGQGTVERAGMVESAADKVDIRHERSRESAEKAVVVLK
jgi:hypothetical protein